MPLTSSDKDMKLYFLGDRNYVQVPLLLEFAFYFINKSNKSKELSSYRLVRFKQVDEVCSSVRLIQREDLNSNAILKSQIDIKCDDQLRRYCLISSSEKIDLRIPTPNYTLSQVSIEKGQNLKGTAKVPPFISFWHLLSEVVELTKRLHQSEYNNQKEQFRFMVGGFEKMDFFLVNNEIEVLITCTVVNHFRHGGNIYNQCLISVSLGEEVHCFYLPFIGRRIL
jgi:hypothetical protein